MSWLRYIVFAGCLAACQGAAWGNQPPRCVLKAATDTLQVGRPFTVIVLSTYLHSKPVFQLADSLLQPFELVSQRRQSRNGQDSLVLQLRTWSVEPLQPLSLGYNWLGARGQQQARTDTLVLRLTRRVQPEQAAQLDYQKDLSKMAEPREPVSDIWLIILLIITGLAIISLCIALLFGKRIRRYRAVRRLRKEELRLLQQLAGLEAQLSTDPRTYLLAANHLWKQALKPLADAAPLDTMTNQELLAWIPGMRPGLQQAGALMLLLAAETRVVYAGEQVPASQLLQQHEQLRACLQEIYAIRKEAQRL
ncbi:MAG: hypothetical protein KF690_02785 [Bacteroidetes bacterium]|nr:hypothetical protein [Bacteroidota bacterium]